jgi:pimeloyl-ACP methyl ester carboxylesterase
MILPPAAVSMFDPFGFGRAAFDYWRDAIERSTLYMDVMRQRGNQYLEHIAKTKPNVLGFESEELLDGRNFSRPVNYELLRILPPDGVETDPQMRPFVVVDPRAGHGPGIGGFKPDSELGVALKAGHPCYFIGFLPYPEPGQTVEDVVEAEIAFVRHVNSLHPSNDEKAMVVGNCQAGWQIMMAASLEPEEFGPILIAGAPLSYWAGERGGAPMRYTGGMTGGSWMTSVLSDLGAGQFDGAWLVENFERLNPANTWWSKQYRLYAQVDTEVDRYLEFERWWGGHVVLGGEEIQYIVDNLFVGNRLSTAQLVTSDGRRIDLRNLRSPVVVFCSRGDDITPPPQALGWIRDLYEDHNDIIANDQTIVYCMHDSTGHLGIFVSGSVSRKEHAEFTANMDFIDVLPPGLYETTVSRADERPDGELIERDYLLEFQTRNFEELNKEIQHRPDDDQRFATLARISEINLGLYRQFVKPAIQAVATPEAAHWMRRMHPNRMGYRLWSDSNPLMVPVPVIAEMVRQDRHPVGNDNIFRALEGVLSSQITHVLDALRELRDRSTERLFLDVYGQPLLQALVGLGGDAHVHRRSPGTEPEHRRFLERRREEVSQSLADGNGEEAVMRAVIYVLGGSASTDGRSFTRLRALRAELDSATGLAEFKHMVREQAAALGHDLKAALAALPAMLEGLSAESIDAHLEEIEHVLAASGDFSKHAGVRLERIKKLFAEARPDAPALIEAKPGKEKEAPGKAVAEKATTEKATAEKATPNASDTKAPRASRSRAERSKRG